MKIRQDIADAVRRPRHSACMARSHAQELARIRSLSVKERIDEALAMGHRFARLKPVARDSAP